jgi:hypothetical protein
MPTIVYFIMISLFSPTIGFLAGTLEPWPVVKACVMAWFKAKRVC